jgi:hypothetical protein
MRYYDRSMAHGQWSPETGPPVSPPNFEQSAIYGDFEKCVV